MSRTGVGCSVYINGNRINDGCENPPDDLAPVVLSGLSFVWGRGTTLDQPEPSTCEFMISDASGGASFIGTYRTGMTVEIRADGTIYGDANKPTFVDPSFDAAAVGTQPGNVRSGTARATVQTIADGNALSLVPVKAANAQAVVIAPADFSEVPGAWDAIPTTDDAQTWHIVTDVLIPVGATAGIQGATFDSPRPDARQTLIGPPVNVIGTGVVQTIEFDVSPTISGEWMGVYIRTSPNGYRWVDFPGAWTDPPAAISWVGTVTTYVASADAFAPDAVSTRTVLAFVGRITDIEISHPDDADAPEIQVTAADFTADLENIRIGDEPFPTEAFSTRFQRVVDLANASASGSLTVGTIIDPGLSATPLAWQDVDSQPAGSLLKDYAQSVDGVLWSAVHETTGPYLRVEDVASRAAPFVLSDNLSGDGTVEIVPSGSATGIVVSACDILRDPVSWVQSVSDVATGVVVSWDEIGVDDDGKTTSTERSVSLIDPDLETDYGQRRISVGTNLATPEDATAIAQRIFSRASFTGWRAGGLTITDADVVIADDIAVLTFLRLLDGTARNGLPILLTDLPSWSPVGDSVSVFLEGATADFIGGAWEFALTVSSGKGLGESVTWNELEPEWAWNQFDPDISWTDLIGVGPEPEGM